MVIADKQAAFGRRAVPANPVTFKIRKAGVRLQWFHQDSGKSRRSYIMRLSLADFIALGELDPRLLPASPYVPRGPQSGCIVERAAPDTDYTVTQSQVPHF